MSIEASQKSGKRFPPAGAAFFSLAIACGTPGRATEPAPANHSKPRVESNLVRADYSGSEACRSCHSEIYEKWKRSPMHRMTRRAEPDEILAPFDGSTFRLQGSTATMQEQGGQRFVRLQTDGEEQLFRVTRVIGGRYREDYAGIDVTGEPDPSSSPGLGVEKVLPVSYVYSSRAFRYKGYSVMLPERTKLMAGPDWAATCIGCHNTLPRLTLLYDDLLGPDAKPYQGSVSDGLLPPERSSSVRVDDESWVKAAVVDELAVLGVSRKRTEELPLPELLSAGIATTRKWLRAEHTIELGVGCEACHGGARQHAEDPRILPSFALEGPGVSEHWPAKTPPERAREVNGVCARCHTVLFSMYPYTWEGGRRSDAVPGGSHINSGEARDFLLGGCATKLSCSSCHDPHAEDSREALRALEGSRGNALCTSCHTELASAERASAHSHHPTDRAGSFCVDCHMPKKNMGLDYQLTRYHRIGSPTDEARVLGDRPLECALCHTDRSVESLVTSMERWWNKRYARPRLRALYGGDLGVNALRAALERGRAHEQATAIGVLGERGAANDVPALSTYLSHEYPLVRYFARHAVERLRGEPLEIDVGAPANEVEAQLHQLRSDAKR